jgi:hypothetical protein
MRYNEIDKLEIIKYCNEEIKTLSPLLCKYRNKLFSYLTEQRISEGIYDDIAGPSASISPDNITEWSSITEDKKKPIKEMWKAITALKIKLSQYNSTRNFITKYLARQQFYRQNNLPVELNLMVEEDVISYNHNVSGPSFERYQELKKFALRCLEFKLEKSGIYKKRKPKELDYDKEEIDKLFHAAKTFLETKFPNQPLPVWCDNWYWLSKGFWYARCYEYTKTSQEIIKFTNQMLEIIEEVASQRHQENENQGEQVENDAPESQTAQAGNSENNDSSSFNSENTACSSSIGSGNGYTNVNSSSLSDSPTYTSSENNFTSLSSTTSQAQEKNQINSPSSSSSQETSPSASSATPIVNSGGGFSGGFTSSSSESKPKNKLTTNQPNLKPENPYKIKPNESSNLTNQTELTKQKQQIIEQIQEKLNQNANLNLPDNWKQEIEQIQSLEAIAAYQKNLLEKVEGERQLLAVKFSESETKHNKNNATPLIISGIAILGIISWSTILIVRKKYNKKGKL